jgi:hypothetical protein
MHNILTSNPNPSRSTVAENAMQCLSRLVSSQHVAMIINKLRLSAPFHHHNLTSSSISTPMHKEWREYQKCIRKNSMVARAH